MIEWRFLKEENTFSTKKKSKIQDKKERKHAIHEEKKQSFNILLFFFYKFPPQSFSRINLLHFLLCLALLSNNK